MHVFYVAFRLLRLLFASASGPVVHASILGDIGSISGIIRAIIDTVTSITQFFVEKTTAAGIDPNWEIVFVLCVLLTLWLGSGCWAGSIAEARRHSDKVHFLLGLLVPWAYPLTILFAMDVKGAKDRAAEAAQAKQAAEEDDRLRLVARGQSPGGDTPAEYEVAGEAYDQEYFKRIAFDDDGNVTGPWLIEYADTEIVATRVLDTLQHAVVLEISQEGSDELQRIRIPYSSITACGPAE